MFWTCCAGGLGAGLTGIIPLREGLFIAILGGPLGGGGAGRGFSKLPSWFCGNLGLAGGEIIPAIGEKGTDVIPPPGVVGP